MVDISRHLVFVQNIFPKHSLSPSSGKLQILLWYRCKITNRCVKELVDLFLYSKFTPPCFGKWLPCSGGRRCLISYSSNNCDVGVYGLHSVQCGQLSFHGIRIKNVWVNLEYSNKSTSYLTHLLVILRYYMMLGPTIKMLLWCVKHMDVCCYI
jgi:hypothetical protein